MTAMKCYQSPVNNGRRQLQDSTNIIFEDINSDIGSDISATLNYNFDVINLKDEETSPFFKIVKDVIEYYNRNSLGDIAPIEDFDAGKAIKSGNTLAIEVDVYMNLADP